MWTWEALFSGLSALAGLASGILWVIASRVDVPAPEQSSGVGALVGGLLIGLDVKGRRIDLLETLKLQATWNSRAAVAAAVTSFLAVLAVIAHLMGK